MRLNDLGLKSTRQQAHTVETAKEFLQKIREEFPRAGISDMTKIAAHSYGQKIPRCVSRQGLTTLIVY
jgi:hypothetical protein